MTKIYKISHIFMILYFSSQRVFNFPNIIQAGIKKTEENQNQLNNLEYRKWMGYTSGVSNSETQCSFNNAVISQYH